MWKAWSFDLRMQESYKDLMSGMNHTARVHSATGQSSFLCSHIVTIQLHAGILKEYFCICCVNENFIMAGVCLVFIVSVNKMHVELQQTNFARP